MFSEITGSLSSDFKSAASANFAIRASHLYYRAALASHGIHSEDDFAAIEFQMASARCTPFPQLAPKRRALVSSGKSISRFKASRSNPLKAKRPKGSGDLERISKSVASLKVPAKNSHERTRE